MYIDESSSESEDDRFILSEDERENDSDHTNVDEMTNTGEIILIQKMDHLKMKKHTNIWMKKY